MSAVSRIKRILDLSLNKEKDDDVCPNSHLNKNKECPNLESSNQHDSRASSPLPPGAENIFNDLADVYHDVFNSDKENMACEQLHDIPVNITAPPQPAACKETSSSKHENEIAQISNDAACCQAALSPVVDPEIVIDHQYEHSASANHLASVSLLDTNQTTEEVPSPFILEVNPSFNNSPNIYIEEFEEPAVSTPSSSQNMVLATPMPSPLNNHKKCADAFCPDHSDWINSVQLHTNGISSLNTPKPKQKKGKKRLVLKNDWSDAKRKCLKNHGKSYVSKRGKFVDPKVMGKPCGCRYFESDNRGKHKHHKSVITDDMVKSVCDHVNSFVPVESHFIRKDSTKLYLDGSLSISQMFKLYNEWFDESLYSSKVFTERQYREIVNKNFNLGFHMPKKDQCEVCHAYRNTTTHTDEETRKYEKHLNSKKTARALKQKDKEDAQKSNESIVTAVFDFQKVLTCPHGQISIFYYKRKLSAFNFTIFNMGQKKAVCYIWDETIAKRGANEVGSCLLDYIENCSTQGAEEFRFWSDNCAGQNRNRFVFAMFLFAAKKFNVSITHHFLEKGHTQNEGDSVHALIERSARSKTIYTPEEWRLLTRWAKTEGEPYLVKNMEQEHFYNFKSTVNDKHWNKTVNKQKILWTKIKEVFVDKSDPNKLYFKYDLNQEFYECLVFRSETRHSSVVPNLERAYSSPLKLPKLKYNDLVSMCNTGVINASNAVYFRSLPYNNESTANNDDLSDDDEN
ncbi:unnamed protein product [Diatraea saccharalis]|uniref:DUF7869 domain-containing protein n=1 Tax=Diatraea saccharalis TaxID=40085 RepID=A0A9N9RCX4_9NEOP|nr:unnamed protein product [Diatraea saccharalis]